MTLQLNTNQIRLTGQVLPDENFRFHEQERFDPSMIVDVLEGKRLGVVFRDFVSDEDCSAICRNFWDHPGRYSRGDAVPAEYIGSYHYLKSLEQYAAESQVANAMLPALFKGLQSPVDRLTASLNEMLSAQGRTLRRARCLEQDACGFVMRSWTGKRNFALEPHDDEAQCQDPRQAGFEIQDAAKSNPLAAVNICLQNGAGGMLRMWNIRPDNESRRKLGLEVTGSPYPLEPLADVSHVDVSIRPGDLYVFDGRFLHAVTTLDANNGGQRATIAFLMANLRARDTISWT